MGQNVRGFPFEAINYREDGKDQIEEGDRRKNVQVRTGLT